MVLAIWVLMRLSCSTTVRQVAGATRVERAALQQPAADGKAGAHIGNTKDEASEGSTHAASLADEVADCL